MPFKKVLLQIGHATGDCSCLLDLLSDLVSPETIGLADDGGTDAD